MENDLYLDHLGSPFLFLEETLVNVAVRGRNQFHNHLPKLLFALEGEMLLSFEGGRPILFQAGDLSFVFGHVVQTYTPPDSGRPGRLRALRLTFSPAEFQKPVKSPRWTDDLISLSVEHLPTTGTLTSEVLSGDWVSAMRVELHRRMPGARQRINALARLVLVDLVRSRVGEETGRPGGKGSAARLEGRISTYLEKHAFEGLTLAKIARAVDRSEEHVARVFKQETGRTVFEELLRLRVERAKYLLLCDDMSVTRISERCGFLTLAHFSRVFRAQTGFSPTAYREDRFAAGRG